MPNNDDDDVLVSCRMGLAHMFIPYGALNSKIKRHREAKIDVDIPQGRNNQC